MSTRRSCRRPRRRPLREFTQCLPAAMALLAATGAAQGAEDAEHLDTITIIGRREPAPILEVKDSAATEYRIGGDALDLFGGAGATNPYTAIAHLPSVNAPGLDPFGMAN